MNALRVLRAADVPPTAASAAWLIESLWSAGAVGVIGGAPKCAKSWLALEMAVSVASGRPCLGRYAVAEAGPVLVFSAEEAPAQVRQRLDHLARARGADFDRLDVHLIAEHSLRLDRRDDLGRLRATLSAHRPKLLVLDPWVRLQRVDENKASEVSAILGALREVSRQFALPIVLVHHARKGGADQPGEGLRGSSDFHAWGDSNLYVRRRGDRIVLSVEHRAAAAPPSVALSLVADDGPVRLEVLDAAADDPELPLRDRILRALEGNAPRRRADLRDALGVRTHDLGQALRELEAAGRITEGAAGWGIAGNP
jgi:hypothetical protein